MQKKYIFIGIVSITLASMLTLTAKKTVIKTNKILIPKTANNYMEVRHIVLRGKNRAIGEALGNLAQEWLGVKPYIYTNIIYGRANRLYLETDYPILSNRLNGVAKAYKIDPEKYIAGALLYDLWPSACSVIYFPGNATESGHTCVARNLDFNPTTFTELLKLPNTKNTHALYSRSFVMELYPTDGGYASIGIGSLDLLSGVVGGMNARGLVVSMLVDSNCPSSSNLRDSIDACGLDGLQLVRLILDTCATVEEAKIALLQNRYVVTFRGIHLQVGDQTGSATIAEVDPKTFNWHFTDNNRQVQIMTNHAQYANPDPERFPPATNPYNSFNRYKKLLAFVTEHTGPFTPADGLRAMSLVYGDRDFPENLPMRTLWTELYDQVDKTLQIRFYLRDGEKDSKTGAVTPVFSEPFTFKLKTLEA